VQQSIAFQCRECRAEYVRAHALISISSAILRFSPVVAAWLSGRLQQSSFHAF